MKEIKLSSLPEPKPFAEGIRRAPKRQSELSKKDMQLAVANALRYCPKEWHDILIPEFTEELLTRGRIIRIQISSRRSYLRQKHRRIRRQMYRRKSLSGNDRQ